MSENSGTLYIKGFKAFLMHCYNCYALFSLPWLSFPLKSSILTKSSDLSRQVLHKKWSFPLRISSVNVTISAGNCGFCHIYWRNPWWKTSFFVQWRFSKGSLKKEGLSKVAYLEMGIAILIQKIS